LIPFPGHKRTGFPLLLGSFNDGWIHIFNSTIEKRGDKFLSL